MCVFSWIFIIGQFKFTFVFQEYDVDQQQMHDAAAAQSTAPMTDQMTRKNKTGLGRI